MSSEILFEDVTLHRSERPVLQEVSLTLKEQRIGIVGRNGSGKSSFASLLNGLLEPTSGKVTVHGLNVSADRAELPGTVGYIFQNPDHQIVFPTVTEEIAFSLEMTGMNRKETKERANAYLASQGLGTWKDKPVHTLSEGQKQWLCVLAVLVMNPAVLILDEPFSSLDLANRIGLMKRLGSLSQQIILISHDLDALRQFDRIIWLDDGRVRMDGAPEAVLDAYRAACEDVKDLISC